MMLLVLCSPWWQESDLPEFVPPSTSRPHGFAHEVNLSEVSDESGRWKQELQHQLASPGVHKGVDLKLKKLLDKVSNAREELIVIERTLERLRSDVNKLHKVKKGGR